MANTLNNFGLAEKTLNTAGKWCTSNIKVKIDSAELKNIEKEYLRAGVEVFGLEGTYGTEPASVTIPAGIYEFNKNITRPCGSTKVPCYYMGEPLINNQIDANIDRVYVYTSAGEDTLVDFDHLLSRLIYVPQNDVELTQAEANDFYACLSPYVSGRLTDEDTFELKDPSDASQLLIDRETGKYANTVYKFKFRTPFMEQNGGVHPCAGIRLENNYQGNISDIEYLNESGHPTLYGLTDYRSNNNELDFASTSYYFGGQYIQPANIQMVDPQVLAWLIVNLKTLNPSGATCKNCGTSTNVSKATNVCDNCDKKYWVGDSCYQTLPSNFTWENIYDQNGNTLDVLVENEMYYDQVISSPWVASESSNRNVTNLTDMELNIPYYTGSKNRCEITTYTTSSPDGHLYIWSPECASDNSGYEYAGRDGELYKISQWSEHPFFIKVPENMYIKNSGVVKVFSEDTLYEVFGDKGVLSCYGGEYWHSDFSDASDRSDSIMCSCSCAYEYCAAKFYMNFGETANGTTPRTCPACSNQIYFRIDEESSSASCSKGTGIGSYLFDGSTWAETNGDEGYSIWSGCPACGAHLYSNNPDGYYTTTNCPNPMCDVELTIAGYNISMGTAHKHYWVGYNDLLGTLTTSMCDPYVDYYYNPSCPHSGCDATFYWNNNPLESYGVNFASGTCPNCKKTIYLSSENSLSANAPGTDPEIPESCPHYSSTYRYEYFEAGQHTVTRVCESCGEQLDEPYYEDCYYEDGSSCMYCSSGSSGGTSPSGCNHDIESESSTVYWVEVGEGNHALYCEYCNETVSTPSSCNYIDHQCGKCGAYEIIGNCNVCDGDIRYGSDYIDDDGSLIHPSCYTGDNDNDDDGMVVCGNYLEGEYGYCDNRGIPGTYCSCGKIFGND